MDFVKRQQIMKITADLFFVPLKKRKLPIICMVEQVIYLLGLQVAL